MGQFTSFKVTRTGGGGWSVDQVRSQRFVTPHRGVRAPRGWTDDLRARSIALAQTAPPRSFLCGISAAACLAVPLPPFVQSRQPSIATATGGSHLHRSSASGRRLDLVPDELVQIDGIWMTSPIRTFLDLARELAVPDLVAAGDAIMQMWGHTQDQFVMALNRRLRYHGKVRARDTIPLLSSLAESPQESRVRAIIALAGLPVPTPQVTVRHPSGRVIARVDLGLEECQLALEYDGEHHWTPERYRHDAARRSELRVAGWTVLEVTSPDLTPRLPSHSWPRQRCPSRQQSLLCAHPPTLSARPH